MKTFRIEPQAQTRLNQDKIQYQTLESPLSHKILSFNQTRTAGASLNRQSPGIQTQKTFGLLKNAAESISTYSPSRTQIFNLLGMKSEHGKFHKVNEASHFFGEKDTRKKENYSSRLQKNSASDHIQDLSELRELSTCVFAEIDNEIFKLKASTEDQKSKIDHIFDLIVNKFIEIRQEIHSTMDSEFEKLSSNLEIYRDKIERGVSLIEGLIDKFEQPQDISVIELMKSKSMLKDLKADQVTLNQQIDYPQIRDQELLFQKIYHAIDSQLQVSSITVDLHFSELVSGFDSKLDLFVNQLGQAKQVVGSPNFWQKSPLKFSEMTNSSIKSARDKVETLRRSNLIQSNRQLNYVGNEDRDALSTKEYLFKTMHRNTANQNGTRQANQRQENDHLSSRLTKNSEQGIQKCPQDLSSIVEKVQPPKKNTYSTPQAFLKPETTFNSVLKNGKYSQGTVRNLERQTVLKEIETKTNKVNDSTSLLIPRENFSQLGQLNSENQKIEFTSSNSVKKMTTRNSHIEPRHDMSYLTCEETLEILEDALQAPESNTGKPPGKTGMQINSKHPYLLNQENIHPSKLKH